MTKTFNRQASLMSTCVHVLPPPFFLLTVLIQRLVSLMREFVRMVGVLRKDQARYSPSHNTPDITSTRIASPSTPWRRSFRERCRPWIKWVDRISMQRSRITACEIIIMPPVIPGVKKNCFEKMPVEKRFRSEFSFILINYIMFNRMNIITITIT